MLFANIVQFLYLYNDTTFFLDLRPMLCAVIHTGKCRLYRKQKVIADCGVCYAIVIILKANCLETEYEICFQCWFKFSCIFTLRLEGIPRYWSSVRLLYIV